MQQRKHPTALRHPHEDHIEALLQGRLEINAGELVAPRIIGQRVAAAGVARGEELDEHSQRRAIACGFSAGDGDRLGIEIRRIDLTAGIDVPDVEDIAAVGSEPAAAQRSKARLGRIGRRCWRNPWCRRGRQGRAYASRLSSAKQAEGGDDPHCQYKSHSEDRYALHARLGGRCAV